MLGRGRTCFWPTIHSLLPKPPFVSWKIGELRRHLAASARRLVQNHYDWHSIGQRFCARLEALVKEQEKA